MPSPTHLGPGAAQYLPTMALSPFAFEEKLNIGFRKVLEGQSYPEFSNNGRDTKHVFAPTNYHETSCDGYENMSTPAQYDIVALTASTPSTPSASTPSTKGRDSCSNTSQSPTPSSSVDFTYTPSRSSSPSMPPPPNSYSCSKCNETFRLQGELNKHWNRKHVKRFSCTAQDCDKAFHLKADLNRHIKSKHEVQAGIPCEYVGCLESFSRKDNMRRHMKEEHEHSKRKRAGSG